MKEIIFHGRDGNSVPKYTVMFQKHDNNLLMAYAKPFLKADIFSKKEALKIVRKRIDNLLFRLTDKKFENRVTYKLFSKNQLEQLLPYDIAKDISYYIVEAEDKTKLKIEKMIFRSDKRTNMICEMNLNLLNI